MSNCGPDIVKYFIVTPLTGDTYVIGGVNTPATNNTNSALINLIYNQGIPFGTYSLPYTDVYVTGGTFSNDILSLRRNDGISIPITGFSSSPTTDVYVTGGTFSINTLTLRRNDGISIPITGFSSVIPPDVYVTGGTYSSGNLTLGRNDGVLISVSGFFTGSTDTYVTGGTYSSGNLTLNSQDNTITITGFTDYYTTGVTLNGNVLEFDRNDTNNAYSVDLSSIKFSGNTSGDCITDIYVSNLNSCSPLHIQNISSGDVLILENGNGFVGIGTLTPTERLDVNGKTKTTRLQVTNGAVSNYVLTSDSFGNASWSQGLDNYVTGGTYSNGSITLNRQNGLVTINGLSTGYTLTSSAINTALGYTPLSASTDTFVTGGTYSNGTLTFNRQNGTFNVTGLSTGYTLTSSAINTALGYTPLSAFTDTFITGITYSNNNIIVGRNQGQSSLTTNISTMTGLTVNGNLTVTGNTSMEGVTASTLNLSTTPANDSTNNNVLVRDVLTGVVKQRDITNALNKNYASFYDTGNQTGLANTVLTMSANTSDSWNTGITLSANTRFVIQNPGVYNLAFSAQMVKTGGNSSTHAHIWLYQNGLDVLYSASQIGFPSNSVYVVPAWNFFFSTTTPNEYVELKWEINSNVDNQLSIKHQPAAGSVPAIPSLIVTINQVN
jgi:hypothetical protein